MTAINIKPELLRVVDTLPSSRQVEVLDFARFLRQQVAASASARELDPQQDPILQYIGGVSHGSLAGDLDRTLYGGRS